MYLEVRWHQSEINELCRYPKLPVCYDSGLEIILQLALDLVAFALQQNPFKKLSHKQAAVMIDMFPSVFHGHSHIAGPTTHLCTQLCILCQQYAVNC